MRGSGWHCDSGCEGSPGCHALPGGMLPSGSLSVVLSTPFRSLPLAPRTPIFPPWKGPDT